MLTGRKKRNILLWLAILVITSGLYVLYVFYSVVYAPNTDLGDRTETHVYIPTGSSYEDVFNLLIKQEVLRNPHSFDRLAKRKNYPGRVRPGRYLIRHGMGNNDLINLLRSGEQHPVWLTFNNIRTREQLAGVIASQLELDSASIINVMLDNEIMHALGFNTLTGKLMFIPNTYQVFWTISPEQLVERMHREYLNYWNSARLQQADHIGLTPIETGILASIVQSETSKPEEFARIAGVYINRLNRNIPLQADPTVIYAMGDFTITRVLNHHLQYDSPYNTYLYSGLPPGPITLPEPRVIDAVLNYEEHDYLYFCALDDLSGYHAFARTYSEHLVNARRYRQALNQRRIFR